MQALRFGYNRESPIHHRAEGLQRHLGPGQGLVLAEMMYERLALQQTAKLVGPQKGQEKMEDRIQSLIIPHLITQLEKEDIAGLKGYEQRLRANTAVMQNLKDLLFEADAALMFSRHGFKVTIQEKPDLRIELDGEIAYAEVKHFREKEQDRKDEKAMQDSEDLVPVGILCPKEEPEAWQQIADVAIRKAEQYVDNNPNLLVIATDSNAVDGFGLPTAVHLYNEEVAESNADSPLRRLNAFMLIDMVKELWTGSESKNVYFCQTAYMAIPLSTKLTDALANIQRWSTPKNITSIRYR